MAGRDSFSKGPPKDSDIIVLSSDDDDEVPARPTVRAGKRPGGEQQPAHPKRMKLNEIGTSISAPSGLADKGKGKDTSLSQRPTHRPSTSGSSIHQALKNPVQRTLSSTFKPKPRASHPTHTSKDSSSSGTRDSSSDDALPPTSSAYSDILKPKREKQAGPSKPQHRHSLAGALGQHLTPRIPFSGEPVKAGSSSTANASTSDPIVIEIDDSDDDKPKPTPIRPKPPSSASAQRNVDSSSKVSTTGKGPRSSIRTPFKPTPPSPTKSGPSTSKSKPPAKTSSADADVEIINVDDSEDELLLSPQKPMPSDSIPVASTSAPVGLNMPSVQKKTIDPLPKTLWKSTPQIEKNASASSTSTAITPRKETPISPRVDLRTFSSLKAPSTGSSNLSSASQTPLSRPLTSRKTVSSSEAASAGPKPSLDAPMMGIVSTSGQQASGVPNTSVSKEAGNISATPRSINRYNPFGKANMLLRKTNNGQPASQSSISSPSTSSLSKTGPSQAPSGVKTPAAASSTPAPDRPANSSAAMPLGSTPGRPSHSRKSSAEVRKEISGIQDGIGAMGIESSATSDSLMKEPDASDPKANSSKPPSWLSRDFELPDSLPPVSCPPSPARPSSSQSTAKKARSASASQPTVTPTLEAQPTSSASTVVKKFSKPSSPPRNTGNVRSGEIDLGDVLLIETLTRLPEIVASEPESNRQESSVPPSKDTPQAANVEPPKAARLPLPSRSTLKLAQSSAATQQSSQASSSRLATKGPFSWNPMNQDGDNADPLRTKSAAQSGQSTPSASSRDAGAPLGISVAQRIKDIEKDEVAAGTGSIISGVLDIPTKPQVPMAPPVLVPGNVASSSRLPEVSSPPLPFFREASSPLSQFDPGPPSSGSPSARNSSPDTAPVTPSTADPSRAVMLPSFPPETSSASPSASDSSAESSSDRPKIHIAHRIARKSTGKQTARKGTIQQPIIPKPADQSLSRPRKPMGRKTTGSRIPSPLKQVAPSSDHESEYNAASSAEPSSHDEQKSNDKRRIKRSKPMVQDSSDSDEVAVYESLMDDPRDTSSTNDEAAPESSSGSSPKGPRLRPRRAAAKTTPYFADDQLPSSQPEPVTEVVVASPPTSQISNEDESRDITVPVKSYGGFQVHSWATFRQDLRNIPMKTYFSKDLPTRLQDQINSWPDYMKQQKDLVTIFRASIVEHTAEDEPNAPIIEIINEVDNEPTPPWEFYYSNHMWYGKDVEPPDLSQLKGCGCVGRCSANPNKCACAKRQAIYLPEGDQGFLYDSRGKLKHPGQQWPIFECNKLCGCDDDCQNRVVQNGRKVNLNLQKTQKKGWGVFAGSKRIPAGSFIGIYAGELITNEEAEERGKNYDKFGRTYLLDIDSWHLVQDMGLDVALTVDAFHAGNFTRFLNHSCEPNCYITAVYINQSDIKQPLLVLFSAKDIKPHEEICFSYYGENDDDELNELANETENDAMFLARCQCGAPTCKGRLWKL